jgi:hypothetical protein
MIVSEVVRQLSQFPHRFPLHVEQGGVVHEILAAEYSHEPARAVLKIAPLPAPAPLPEPEATIAELRGEVPPAPVPFTIGEILAEVLPPEVVRDATEDIGSGVKGDDLVPAAPKRTRKPKTAPFGTA